MQSDDLRYMSRALSLARKGLFTTDPNPRVGCVLVRNGEIVGEGWHERPGAAHAEVHALERAGDKARGATAYVSLEPCCHLGHTGPCTEALIEAGVSRTVAAMLDPNPLVNGRGLAALEAAGIEVEVGVLESAAHALNRGFCFRMSRQRPYIRCKLAMSLDARTATASGESKWITSAAARRDVQRLRARSSAIMTGIGTVLADDPSLTVREADLGEAEPHTPIHQPIPIVLDSQLRTPPSAKLLGLSRKTLIVCASDDRERMSALSEAGAEVIVVPDEHGRVDLGCLAKVLAERWVNELMLEGGPTLSGAMLQAGLIDEFVIYVAPVLLGDAARGLFELPGLDSLSQRVNLDITDVRAVGKDWRITAKPR